MPILQGPALCLRTYRKHEVDSGFRQHMGRGAGRVGAEGVVKIDQNMLCLCIKLSNDFFLKERKRRPSTLAPCTDPTQAAP